MRYSISIFFFASKMRRRDLFHPNRGISQHFDLPNMGGRPVVVYKYYIYAVLFFANFSRHNKHFWQNFSLNVLIYNKQTRFYKEKSVPNYPQHSPNSLYLNRQKNVALLFLYILGSILYIP